MPGPFRTDTHPVRAEARCTIYGPGRGINRPNGTTSVRLLDVAAACVHAATECTGGRGLGRPRKHSDLTRKVCSESERIEDGGGLQRKARGRKGKTVRRGRAVWDAPSISIPDKHGPFHHYPGKLQMSVPPKPCLSESFVAERQGRTEEMERVCPTRCAEWPRCRTHKRTRNEGPPTPRLPIQTGEGKSEVMTSEFADRSYRIFKPRKVRQFLKIWYHINSTYLGRRYLEVDI